MVLDAGTAAVRGVQLLPLLGLDNLERRRGTLVRRIEQAVAVLTQQVAIVDRRRRLLDAWLLEKLAPRAEPQRRDERIRSSVELLALGRPGDQRAEALLERREREMCVRVGDWRRAWEAYPNELAIGGTALDLSVVRQARGTLGREARIFRPVRIERPQVAPRLGLDELPACATGNQVAVLARDLAARLSAHLALVPLLLVALEPPRSDPEAVGDRCLLLQQLQDSCTLEGVLVVALFLWRANERAQARQEGVRSTHDHTHRSPKEQRTRFEYRRALDAAHVRSELRATAVLVVQVGPCLLGDALEAAELHGIDEIVMAQQEMVLDRPRAVRLDPLAEPVGVEPQESALGIGANQGHDGVVLLLVLLDQLLDFCLAFGIGARLMMMMMMQSPSEKKSSYGNEGGRGRDTECVRWRR